MDDVSEILTKSFLPVIQALVDYPDSIKISSVSSSNRTVLLQVSLHPDDTGKVIGRSGKHADALRILMSAAAGRYNCRVIFEVIA